MMLLAVNLHAGDVVDGGSAVLVPPGAVWKYLDNGTNSGQAWRDPMFDDSNWPSGPAPLGYDPQTPPSTIIGYGPDEENKHMAAWFRRSFVVTNAVNGQRLRLRVLRDDGVVVYLNGSEVFRDNLPAGEILSTTPAIVSVEETGVFHAVDFAGRLREGTNVLAVEIHQSASNSSDLLFDLELGCTLTRGPYLQKGTANTMQVRWRTPDPTDGFVVCGTNLNALTATYSDAALTNDHCVTLTNLIPNTRYYYAIRTSSRRLASGPGLSFITAPAGPQPVRIWAIGDCGAVNYGLPWARVVRDAYRQFAGARPTDVWLMLGDNAYSSGTDREYQTAVFDIYQELLASTPPWSTLGNHEAYDPTAEDEFHLSYFGIFSPPTAGEAGGLASGTKNYYSFDYGNVHFVCLDSMLSDRSSNGVMCTWLKEDLAANTNDWLIAFWHHPPYSRGNHNSDNSTGGDPELVAMRENVVPILEANGVDLVLSGHCHSYERSYLLDGHYGNSTTLVPAMIKDSGSGRPGETGAYRKSGTGPTPQQGAVYMVAGSSASTTGGLLDHPAMFISLNQPGSVVIDVEGNRLDAKFLRETGAIDDHFTIEKGVLPEPLRFVTLTLSGGIITARWKSEAGWTYRLEKTAGFPASDWVSASGPIVASGATTSWSGVIDPADGQCFYRVVGSAGGL